MPGPPRILNGGQGDEKEKKEKKIVTIAPQFQKKKSFFVALEILEEISKATGLGDDRVVELVTKIQRQVRRFLLLQRVRKLARAYKQSEASKVDRKRSRVLMEIVDTERSYVASLSLVKTTYLTPLKVNGMISDKEEFAIFGNFIELYRGNKGILKEFADAFQRWPNENHFGQVFLDLEKVIGAYTTYILNYGRAAKILKQKMKEDKKFGTFIRKKNREAGEGRDLQHFLIMPVQRLPRYQLLLNELIKNTPVDHTDIECLKVALVKIRKGVNQINTRQKMAEGLGEVLSQIIGLEQAILDAGVTQVSQWKAMNGWIECKGELRVDHPSVFKLKSIAGYNYAQEFKAFLFCRCLLLCKKSTKLDSITLSGKMKQSSDFEEFKSNNKAKSQTFLAFKCITWDRILDVCQISATKFEVYIMEKDIVRSLPFSCAKEETMSMWSSSFLSLITGDEVLPVPPVTWSEGDVSVQLKFGLRDIETPPFSSSLHSPDTPFMLRILLNDQSKSLRVCQNVEQDPLDSSNKTSLNIKTSYHNHDTVSITLSTCKSKNKRKQSFVSLLDDPSSLPSSSPSSLGPPALGSPSLGCSASPSCDSSPALSTLSPSPLDSPPQQSPSLVFPSSGGGAILGGRCYFGEKKIKQNSDQEDDDIVLKKALSSSPYSSTLTASPAFPSRSPPPSRPPPSALPSSTTAPTTTNNNKSPSPLRASASQVYAPSPRRSPSRSPVRSPSQSLISSPSQFKNSLPPPSSSLSPSQSFMRSPINRSGSRSPVSPNQKQNRLRRYSLVGRPQSFANGSFISGIEGSKLSSVQISLLHLKFCIAQATKNNSCQIPLFLKDIKDPNKVAGVVTVSICVVAQKKKKEKGEEEGREEREEKMEEKKEKREKKEKTEKELKKKKESEQKHKEKKEKNRDKHKEKHRADKDKRKEKEREKEKEKEKEGEKEEEKEKKTENGENEGIQEIETRNENEVEKAEESEEKNEEKKEKEIDENRTKR